MKTVYVVQNPNNRITPNAVCSSKQEAIKISWELYSAENNDFTFNDWYNGEYYDFWITEYVLNEVSRY